MQSIRVWLNGKRNYDAGVKIFLLYSKDPLLKRLFQEKTQSDFKKQKLVDCLEELLEGNTAAAVITETAEKKTVSKLENESRPTKGWSSAPDEVESALKLKWEPLYNEMTMLCSRVGMISKQARDEYDPVKKAEATRMALRILDLDDLCDEIYEDRDYYVKNKLLPVKFPYGEPCMDPKLIYKKLQNHQKYLREQKAKLKEDPANADTAALVIKHQWYVDHYKKVLEKV